MLRTTLAALAAALMLMPFANATLIEAPEAELPPGTGQLIVGFYEMPDIREGDLYLGEPVVSTTPELAFITVRPVSVDLFNAKVQVDENVRYVESDVSDHKLQYTPNDYFWTHGSNWGVKKIGLETVWNTLLGSTAVKVGMVDSGLNKGHEEYAGNSRVLGGWDYYGGTSNPADNSGCSWHGTHTTGIAGAPINNGKGFAGVSQHMILPVKIFGGGACFAASTTNLANALKYVANQGSHISSNSWGGGAYSQAIHDAITYAHNLGTIHIAASGNGACSNCVGNPWAPQETRTIIVTATDSNDAGASFNSKGPQTDVSAPGVYVGSSTSGTTGYHIMDGTSQATPHVSGVAALIKALNPTFTFAQMESRLKSTAVDLGAAGEDDTFGAGRINAIAAVY